MLEALEFLRQQPFPLAISALFVIVNLRAQGTYWVGRAVSTAALATGDELTWRGRTRAWITDENGPGMRAIRQMGWVVLPLCFLTVGLQTAVLASAGALRWHWGRFSLAILPGALAWAVIYATIGLAIWNAALAAVAGSPWGIAALVAFVGAGIALYLLHRQRAKALKTKVEAVAVTA
ncbi:MAG: hypothetical protein Q3999_05260 [Buchananella hordeovulneris]|nr:hypothetical protein [Buchananella hordeovulneris]